MIDDEAINELIKDVELLKSQVLALPGTEISDLKNDIRELNDAIKRIDEEEIIALRKEIGQIKEAVSTLINFRIDLEKQGFYKTENYVSDATSYEASEDNTDAEADAEADADAEVVADEHNENTEII